MKKRYKILYGSGEAVIEEKKSRFIATSCSIQTEEEALEFLAGLRKKYWDASHNCFAYVLGENNEIMRAGDDGEPAQTAGRPMLDVLLGEEVHNACVVVTRYFGGTLLGTGGLVRAYSKATQEGLKNSLIVEKCLADQIEVETNYTDLGKIQYILGEAGITPLNSDYSDKVSLKLLVPVEETEHLIKKLTEGTAGRCKMEQLKQDYFAIINKEIVLL